MSDIVPPGGRPLSDTERQAFQRLDLSPGNWAALVAAPFYNRSGVRPFALHQRGDCLHLETLRRELRTASGLSEQTRRFWERLAAGAAPEETDVGTRLLAWHLATDATFAKRERVLRLLGATAGELATSTLRRADQSLVADLRLLIDYYLPCRSFPAESTPRWTYIPTPSADALRTIAPTIAPSGEYGWPPVLPALVAAQLPTLVGLLGEPVGDWWGQAVLGHRAVERGMAALSFAERERLYEELAREWQRAHAPGRGEAGAPGTALADGIREWVDAVRKFTRLSTPTPEPRKGLRDVTALAPVAPPVVPPTPAVPSSAAPPREGQPVAAAVELRALTTGKTLRLEDGMRVGRAEYRAVFKLAEAGLAAADQFELVCNAAKGVWLVKPVGAPRHPTRYQGTEVKPEGCELAADGVISVGGKLELVVRFA